MPRDQGGIGRTGKKHKKKALFNVHRQPKSTEAMVQPAAAETKDGTAKLAETITAGASAHALITPQSRSIEPIIGT